MLKMAYHKGVQKALSEEDVDLIIKEAQELGIAVEKLAFLGGIGRGIMSGAKALGSGLKGLGAGAKEGWSAGKGVAFGGSPTMAGLQGAKGGMQSALAGMGGARRTALGVGGLGAAGLAAAPAMMGGEEPPPQAEAGVNPLMAAFQRWRQRQGSQPNI